MKKLNYELKQLQNNNKQGSFNTQRNRGRILQQMANDLDAMGFKKMAAKSIKGRHVQALINHWQSDTGAKRALSTGTIKNRMAVLRWWSNKVGKRGLVAGSNEHYGLANRVYVTGLDKSSELAASKLSKVTDEDVKLSLRLQAAFGLRREEAIKFIASYADRGDHIRLKGSWAKGGRPRVVPVRTEKQRELLNAVRERAGYGGALIPAHKNYIQQLRSYTYQTIKAGLHRNHGLRHRYAQDRYRELTGREPPCCGGPARAELSKKDFRTDRKARKQIALELGHNRIQIVATYCG